MSIKRFGAWLLVLCLLCLGTGCAALTQPTQGFEKASLDFTQRLRWQDYNEAGRYFVGEKHRTAFLNRFSGLEDLHIVDVVVDRAELGPRAGEATTWMTIQYYLLPSPVVKKFHLRLHWRQQAGSELQPGAWRISSAFPPFP